MKCDEIRKWIEDNIEQSLEQWKADALRKCTEASSWVEEIRQEVETWRRSVVQQCLEQPCVWICLCCNKWFCWLVELLTRVIETVLQLIEHVIEAVCMLLVIITWLIIWTFVQIGKWVVTAIVCLIEGACALLILL